MNISAQLLFYFPALFLSNIVVRFNYCWDKETNLEKVRVSFFVNCYFAILLAGFVHSENLFYPDFNKMLNLQRKLPNK
jgi:hypothetical protein